MVHIYTIPVLVLCKQFLIRFILIWLQLKTGEKYTRVNFNKLYDTLHTIYEKGMYIVCVYIYIYVYIYAGRPRRNVLDFGRVFLMVKYTDITQNTCVQS
jgi:hypothetical protein